MPALPFVPPEYVGQRLLKAQYDPGNLFRMNYNILPAPVG